MKPEQFFKIRSGIKAKAPIPPNHPARIEKYIKSNEWLYTRGAGVPTLCQGSEYVPHGHPVSLDRGPPWPPIFEACLQGDLDLVAKWLDSGYAKVNDRNPRTGRALLHDAADRGNVQLCKMLLDDYKAKVIHPTTMGGDTPLHLAVKSGHRHLVFCLLTRGADPRAVNKFGYTPLHYVDRKSIAGQLLSYGGSLMVRNKKGRLPWECVEDLYPWNKELIEHLQHLTHLEETGFFRDKLQETKAVADADRIQQAIIEHLKAQRHRKANEVLTRATVNYLKWRHGGKWAYHK